MPVRITAMLAALLLALPAAATAAPAPGASCVALITTAETHLAPGFVGDELKEAAPQSAGSLGADVRGLAREHAGSVPACVGGE